MSDESKREVEHKPEDEGVTWFRIPDGTYSGSELISTMYEIAAPTAKDKRN